MHCSDLIINVELIEAFTEVKQDKRNLPAWTPCFSENKFILLPRDPLPHSTAPFPQNGCGAWRLLLFCPKTRRWGDGHRGRWVWGRGELREKRVWCEWSFLLPSPGPLFDRGFPYRLRLGNYWAMQQPQRMPKGSKTERDTGRNWLHVIFKKVNNDMALWLTV